MNGSGLAEAWVESDLLGANATEHVMNGKAYKRAMRAHKLTSQVLWRAGLINSTVLRAH